MKKSLLTLGALLLFTLCFALFGVAKANAATWTVTSTAFTNDFTCDANCTILDAVEAAKADGEASIINFNLTYPATINADNTAGITFDYDDVTMTGPGENNLTIKGTVATNYDGIVVQGSNVSISGMTIQNFGHNGVLFIGEDSQGNTISNMTIEDNDWCGVQVYHSPGSNTVSDSTIRNSGTIQIDVSPGSGQSSGYNTFENNTIDGGVGSGIKIDTDSGFGGTDNIIIGNTITNNSNAGIEILSEGNTIENNQFSSNPDGDLYLDTDSGENTILGNTFSNCGSSGCILDISSGSNLVSNNDFSSYTHFGVVIVGNNSTYSGNTFHDSSHVFSEKYLSSLTPLAYNGTKYADDFMGLGICSGDGIYYATNDLMSGAPVCQDDTPLDSFGSDISTQGKDAGGFLAIMLTAGPSKGTFLLPNGSVGITDLASCNAVLGGMGGTCEAFKADYFDYDALSEEFSWTGLSGFETAGGTVSIASGYSDDPYLDRQAGYSDYAYALVSSNNTFEDEAFTNIGNGFLFSETTGGVSAGNNIISDSSLDTLGYDIGSDTDSALTYLQNSSFSRDRLNIESGTLDVSQNLRAKVMQGVAASSEGEAAAFPLANATITFTDSGGTVDKTLTTGADGYTSYELLDSYQMITGNVLTEDQNPYAVTATNEGASDSTTITLDGPSKEVDLYLGSPHTNGFIATTPASSGGPQVLLYTPDGTMISNFMAYDESLRGDFKSLAGNLRGTGEDELIAFPGPGFGPQLRVFKADGTPLASTMVYNEAFRGGMNATVGDFNGDGLDEIAVAPESSGGAQVMVYRMEGNELKLMAQFEAYEEGYMGGLNLSSGDTDASGRDALITVPTTGNTSHVKLFNYNNGSFNLGPHTFAFGEDFRGGTNVTTGDLNGNGQAEIIVSPESNGGPNVRIYSQTGGTLTLLDWTFAYQEDFFGGVNITTGDLTGDGKAELITAPMSEGGPNLRVYTLNDSTLDLLDWLFVYDEDFHGGLNVVAQDMNEDGKAELVVAPRSNGGPNVRVYNYSNQLNLLDWFWAFDENFQGGVNLSAGRR